MHARLSVCLFACLSVCIPVCLHVCVHVFYPSACEFVCLSVQKFGTGALRVAHSGSALLRLRSGSAPLWSLQKVDQPDHFLLTC
jgi:hypothetical protein